MQSISSAITLFNACLHAYRAVCCATEMGADSVIWDVRMRIELTRFEVWGRTLGFLDERTGKEKEKPNRGAPSASALDLADILQIDAARDLVHKILKSLQGTLNDFKNVADKYRLDPSKEVQRHQSSAESGRRLDAQVRRVWTSTKDLSLHLVLALKDKDRMRNLLQTLTDLNDGLEKVLSLAQKAQAARSLASQVLSQYESPTELEVFFRSRMEIGDPSQDGLRAIPQTHEALAATAKVKRLICLSWTGEVPPIGSFELSKNQFRLSSLPSRDRLKRAWHPTLAEYYGPGDNNTPSWVLIEWRSASPGWSSSKITEADLFQRRNEIVALLREFSSLSHNVMPTCRVLNCLGWLASSTASTRFESSRDIIGFASELPAFADKHRPPISLRTLLDRSDKDGGSSTPSLRVRFRIASALAQVFHQLQCSQWLHRDLRSHNILFFYDTDTTALRLDAPFLTGLQHSRPDDQLIDGAEAYGQPASEGMELSNPATSSLDSDYIHPGLLNKEKRRRYRRSDDVYSLGVILLEIAMWEPANAYFKIDSPGHRAKQLLQVARDELAADVGEIYQQAVLTCLDELQKASDNKEKDEMEIDEDEDNISTEDREYNIESDFLWKVVRQLEKLRV